MTTKNQTRRINKLRTALKAATYAICNPHPDDLADYTIAYINTVGDDDFEVLLAGEGADCGTNFGPLDELRQEDSDLDQYISTLDELEAENRKPDSGVELTTGHPSSRGGAPVLLINGRPYGPRDSIADTHYAFGTSDVPATAGYAVATWANAGAAMPEAARLFCSQWPDGPQPKAAPKPTAAQTARLRNGLNCMIRE